MFSLIPWKKRRENIAVRRGEPVSELSRDFGREIYPLAHLRDDFDALMDRFFAQSLGGFPSLGEESQRGWNMDWEDREKEYVFHADVPGFEPADFDVKVSGNMVTVRAEHKEEEKGKNGGSSYRYGSFVRSFTLPRGVDQQKIDARYHSGVLELHLPKTEEVSGKRIEVKAT